MRDMDEAFEEYLNKLTGVKDVSDVEVADGIYSGTKNKKRSLTRFDKNSRGFNKKRRARKNEVIKWSWRFTSGIKLLC